MVTSINLQYENIGVELLANSISLRWNSHAPNNASKSRGLANLHVKNLQFLNFAHLKVTSEKSQFLKIEFSIFFPTKSIFNNSKFI